MARVEFGRGEFGTLFPPGTGAPRIQALFEDLQDARPGTSRQIDDAMDAVNAAAEGHGVEAIRGEGHHVDNYHFDTIATYVNMGDTYAPTLLYDTENRTFFLTSYGDWLEQWEAEHQREDVCVSCGQQFTIEELTYDDDGRGATCADCKPPSVWSPSSDDFWFATLRSVEGYEVHTFADRRDKTSLAFGVPVPHKNDVYFADQWGRPIEMSLKQLLERFKRQERVAVALDGTLEDPDVFIEGTQLERLRVALDAFMEHGVADAKFLQLPPHIFRCSMLRIDWWSERDRSVVTAYGARNDKEEHVVWTATDEAVAELIQDGFIKWGNDSTVREYLRHLKLCDPT